MMYTFWFFCWVPYVSSKFSLLHKVSNQVFPNPVIATVVVQLISPYIDVLAPVVVLSKSLGISPYAYIAWYSTKESRGILMLFLKLFFYINPSFRVLTPSNSSHLTITKPPSLSFQLSETVVLSLGFVQVGSFQITLNGTF